MQVTVDIPDQVVVKAAALGISIEEYVREVLIRETGSHPRVSRFSTPQESRAWLEKLAQFSDQIPQLPDEAFTRESFYQDHD
ncbi:MAG TPA: hypothetical protein VGI45_04820 [Terracidiphilus sp.]|jgi:hypothetical protein